MKDYKRSTSAQELPKFQGKTRASNMVRSAVHRWFHLYERPISIKRIDSQMELLDDKVRILTSIGAFSGKNEFHNYLQDFENLNSAYHLEDINVYPSGVGIYTAQTTIFYQVKDVVGETKSCTLSFEADLIKSDELNFKFIRIKIKRLNDLNDPFIDAYSINRAKALIHHCMGLIEYNVTDPKKLTNCFLPGFKVHPLDYAPITDENQLVQWIAQVNEKIGSVSITPVNLIVKNSESIENEHSLEFDLLFEGETTDGKSKNSLSKNIWVVQDDPEEYLPKIKLIQVEKLEPIFI